MSASLLSRPLRFREPGMAPQRSRRRPSFVVAVVVATLLAGTGLAGAEEARTSGTTVDLLEIDVTFANTSTGTTLSPVWAAMHDADAEIDPALAADLVGATSAAAVPVDDDAASTLLTSNGTFAPGESASVRFTVPLTDRYRYFSYLAALPGASGGAVHEASVPLWDDAGQTTVARLAVAETSADGAAPVGEFRFETTLLPAGPAVVVVDPLPPVPTPTGNPVPPVVVPPPTTTPVPPVVVPPPTVDPPTNPSPVIPPTVAPAPVAPSPVLPPSPVAPPPVLPPPFVPPPSVLGDPVALVERAFSPSVAPPNSLFVDPASARQLLAVVRRGNGYPLWDLPGFLPDPFGQLVASDGDTATVSVLPPAGLGVDITLVSAGDSWQITTEDACRYVIEFGMLEGICTGDPLRPVANPNAFARRSFAETAAALANLAQ